jgi:FAD/FMN-containing dehydrogenase/ferredoxin
MSKTPDPDKLFGQPLSEFERLSPDARGRLAREAVPDLHQFFDGDRPLAEREAPSRTRALAQSLFAALGGGTDAAEKALAERIVTDGLLRSELDRDQNVYLGPLFTRTLTRAVPDLAFQPASLAEAAAALTWGRENQVPVTLRGAGSTAMGGSVPSDAGLVLDLARLDQIEVDAEDEVCVIGAGARMRDVHRVLAGQELALKVYPSNLGGTMVGWFVTGGVGMNAFAHGRVLDSVRAADLLFPDGTHVRLHDDGRLDVPAGHGRRTLTATEAKEWFRTTSRPELTLADLAGSEGVFGLVLRITVEVEPRPAIGAFLLGFEGGDDALEAAAWIASRAGAQFPRPANLKYLDAAHIEHTMKVWEDEDARAWRAAPGGYSAGRNMPFRRIAGPSELGVAVPAATAPLERNGKPASPASGPAHAPAGAYLFVDFLDLLAAREFASALAQVPHHPRVLDQESVRFAAERFRPQQTKRLGPGLLAAEILMPAPEVRRYLPKAEQLASRAGAHLDAEIYFVKDDSALVIAGYLVDHRAADFALDLVLAPALLDLAMERFGGRPYVLGRWQAPYAGRKLGRDAHRRVAAAKKALDPQAIVNRGVLLDMRLRGPLGALLRSTMVPGVGFARRLLGVPLLTQPARMVLGALPGPAAGRGEPAAIGRATAARSASGLTMPGSPQSLLAAGHGGFVAEPQQRPENRALHCVNCGECNTVCPVFQDSGVRLPQMLTHVGEAMRGGQAIPESGSVLLDLCMRCGNCEEVCQAGIPHLQLYDRMQRASDKVRPRNRARHVGILAALRASPRYLRDFLDVRPGGYLRRTPASLPGVVRYLLFRSENDAGPAATCIHCGACVAVCPTHANREFEGEDPRWITTEQERCIGCGTCVEVCPANHLNGGQTLRVVEAPTPAWFVAIEEFERTVR